MKRSTLNIQTEGLNKLRIYSLQILESILPQLEILKGVKILNIDGNKSKKYILTPFVREDEKEENKYTSYQYYIEFGSTVWLKVKICINGGSYDNNTAYTQYFEQSYYIGKMEQNGMILKEVETMEKILEYNILRRTYTEENLSDLINKLQKAKDEASILFNSIPESVRQAVHLNRTI